MDGPRKRRALRGVWRDVLCGRCGPHTKLGALRQRPGTAFAGSERRNITILHALCRLEQTGDIGAAGYFGKLGFYFALHFTQRAVNRDYQRFLQSFRIVRIDNLLI